MSQTAAKQLERMEGYVSGLRSVQRIINDAKREEKVWCKARCNAILADCRKRFYCVVDHLPNTDFSAREISFSCVVDLFWTTLAPPPGVSHTDLVCRVYKAEGLADMLDWLLSSAIIVESKYPVIEEEIAS